MGCDIGGWGQPYGEERRLLFRIAGAELVANATSGPPPPAPSPSAPVSAIIGSLLNVNVSLANVRNLPDGGVLRGRPVIRWNGTTASSICDDGFGDMHAAAVCKMLGYPGGGLAFSDAPFGFEPTQPALASLNCSAGQGPEGCLAYSIADGTCIPQESVGVVCYPAVNETGYCASVASAIASFPPVGDCGQLLAAGAAVSAVLRNWFPGKPLDYAFSSASSLPCFGSYVAPLLFNWLDAWQAAVRGNNCTLLPFAWMEDLRQRTNSSCPAALATWRSKHGSLEEPRYMVLRRMDSWQRCGGPTAWPSSKLDFLWHPNTSTPNATAAALNAASLLDSNVFLPRRLSNDKLISGVLNSFSRRWGIRYQSNSSAPATAADPLANLTIKPTCAVMTRGAPGWNLYNAIRNTYSSTWGQRALMPDDVLAGCTAGKGRFALSSVTLRGLADQPSPAHEVVPQLLGAFEDPMDSADTPRLPVENLGMLDLAGNTLTGSIPAITSPVLYLDLSNNMLDANLTASLQALPADAFSATLVLDLSGNKLFGALPPAATGPRSGLPNAWRNLLASAVRVDLSANALTGPLPPSWSSLLDEMDLLLHNNTGLRGRVPEEWLAVVKKADWFSKGRMLDVTGCSGLDVWTYHEANAYGVLRMRGTPLKVRMRQDAGGDPWALIVDRVARRHMDFNQVDYVKKKTVSDVFINTQDKVDPEDVMSICTAIEGVRRNRGNDPAPARAAAWPRELDHVQVHDNYKQWQPDPTLWCYGGWQARGQVAAKVWIPALVIFVLAVLLPLPLHRLRLRVIARNRARAAMAVATMQRQEQIKGVEKAYGEEEGGARRPRSFWGATWAYIVRAWSWLEPVLEVVEPRLCVVIYWTDVVSDFVFVTGYKGWSRQPAPAITVLFIILGNMTFLWILHIMVHRKDLGRAGWSRTTCVLVGLATAPLGIAFELVWNAFLAVVTFATIVPACRNHCSGVNAHSDVLSRVTRNLHPLLKYDGNARLFEMSMLMEPLTESLPQAIVQTTCYIVGRQAGIVILTDIYLFSSILGAISISKSMLIIAWRVFWAGSWTDVMCVRDVERGAFVRNEGRAPAPGKAGDIGGADPQPPPPPPPPSTVAMVAGPFVPPAPEASPSKLRSLLALRPTGCLKPCGRPSADGASTSAGSADDVLVRVSVQQSDQVDTQNPVYGRYDAVHGSQPLMPSWPYNTPPPPPTFDQVPPPPPLLAVLAHFPEQGQQQQQQQQQQQHAHGVSSPLASSFVPPPAPAFIMGSGRFT